MSEVHSPIPLSSIIGNFQNTTLAPINRTSLKNSTDRIYSLSHEALEQNEEETGCRPWSCLKENVAYAWTKVIHFINQVFFFIKYRVFWCLYSRGMSEEALLKKELQAFYEEILPQVGNKTKEETQKSFDTLREVAKEKIYEEFAKKYPNEKEEMKPDDIRVAVIVKDMIEKLK